MSNSMEKISKAEFVRIAQANKLVFVNYGWGCTATLSNIKERIDNFKKLDLMKAVSDPKKNRELQNKDLTWLRFLIQKGRPCTYLNISGKNCSCHRYKNYLIVFVKYFTCDHEKAANYLIFQVGTEIQCEMSKKILVKLTNCYQIEYTEEQLRETIVDYNILLEATLTLINPKFRLENHERPIDYKRLKEVYTSSGYNKEYIDEVFKDKL